MRTLFTIITCILISITSNAQALAKPPEPATNKVALYQQPDKKAAVVATVAPGAPIMPIFTQGEWTKVADPSNGNVGWVSNDTLKQAQLPQLKILTSTGKNANDNSSYRVVQYSSGSSTVDDQQLARMMRAWQEQQVMLQRTLGQLIEQSAAGLNAVAAQLREQPVQMPLVVPMVVMPAASESTAEVKK